MKEIIRFKANVYLSYVQFKDGENKFVFKKKKKKGGL
jgi:hypothetical protein